jgi:hypothetical protein
MKSSVSTCAHCKIDFAVKKNTSGKFCSTTCSGAFQRAKTRDAIERGENKTDTGVREYLIEKFGESCGECGIGPVWNGKPLTLHLDHINGDSDNNRWHNCRLLCPNCHTQTDTFGAKGIGSRYKKVTKRNVYLQGYKSGKPAPKRKSAEVLELSCPVCAKEFSRAGRDVRFKKSQNPNYVPTCSISCGAKLMHSKKEELLRT